MLATIKTFNVYILSVLKHYIKDRNRNFGIKAAAFTISANSRIRDNLGVSHVKDEVEIVVRPMKNRAH